MTIKNIFAIHWGHALLIFFIAYISFLIFVVFKSTTIHQSLVTDNYYQEDLDYQSHYNRLEANMSLPIKYDRSQVKIETKDKGITKMDINFYRPSDNRRDKHFSYENFDKNITIPVDELIPGRWIVKAKWSDVNGDYYSEKEILIQQ